MLGPEVSRRARGWGPEVPRQRGTRGAWSAEGRRTAPDSGAPADDEQKMREAGRTTLPPEVGAFSEDGSTR